MYLAAGRQFVSLSIVCPHVPSKRGDPDNRLANFAILKRVRMLKQKINSHDFAREKRGLPGSIRRDPKWVPIRGLSGSGRVHPRAWVLAARLRPANRNSEGRSNRENEVYPALNSRAKITPNARFTRF